MRLAESDWNFILLIFLVIDMIAINELGYGVFALLLLLPTNWPMEKIFGAGEPRDKAGLLLRKPN